MPHTSPATRDPAVSSAPDPIGSAQDPAWFRRVLGQYPTGVCIITAVSPGGHATGMVVGSFTSVSLDPPMVAFYPSKASKTWPELRDATSWCVNILSAGQSELCRQFATAPAGERFHGITTRPAPSGAPIIQDSVAWIDCVPDEVVDAGDHSIALARVEHLQITSNELPLLFFRGGYGSFSPLTLTAHDPDHALTRPLRHFELARPVLQEIADHGLRCLVTARTADHIVVIGQFDPPSVPAPSRPSTFVGQQLPRRPPGPSVFEAWSPESEIEAWLAPYDAGFVAQERAGLARIRERGFSVGLTGDAHRRFALAMEQLAAEPGAVPLDELAVLVTDLTYEPAALDDATLASARLVSAPVFDETGRVALAVTAFDLPREPARVRSAIDHVVASARRATSAIAGRDRS